MERRGGALPLRVGVLAGAEMLTRLSDCDDDDMMMVESFCSHIMCAENNYVIDSNDSFISIQKQDHYR